MKSKSLLWKFLCVKAIGVFTLLIMLNGNAYSQADFNPNGWNGTPNALTDNFGITSAIWTTLTASPQAQSRSCITFATVGGMDYIYQFGGGGGALLTNVARYNIISGTWTNNYSTMPFSISSGTAITVDDSLIYVFGGNNPTLGKTLKYNYIANTWQTMVDMTTPVTDAAVVKYTNNLIYVIGGGTGLFGAGYFNNVQLYNVSSNSYSSATNYPLAVGMQGFGIYGDTIIVAGGWNGAAAVANAYKGIINSGDPTQITWTPIGNYPEGPTTRIASYFVQKDMGGGVMFAGGALNGATTLSTSYLYNMCTGTWDVLEIISVARSNFKGAGNGSESAYVCAGYTGAAGTGAFDRVDFLEIDGSCFTVTSLDPVSNVIPDRYILSQNYPNPFNPVTKIRFEIPEQGFITLKVYDVLGKEVANLVSDVKDAGIYIVDFNGSELSSGTYFYRLQVGSFVQVKRMILLK